MTCWVHYQRPVFPRGEELDKELGRAFQDRINLFEVFPIPIETVVVEKVLANPMSALLVATAMTILRGKSINVSVEPHAPAFVDAKGLACGVRARLRQDFGPVGEWPKRFRKVGRIDHPIIHLDVDVSVIVAVPSRFKIRIPKALQVGRNWRTARTTELKITAIVKVQVLQFHAASFDKFVGSQSRRVETQLQLAAIHQC